MLLLSVNNDYNFPLLFSSSCNDMLKSYKLESSNIMLYEPIDPYLAVLPFICISSDNSSERKV